MIFLKSAAVAVLAVGIQGSVKLNQSFKVGDKVSYKMHMVEHLESVDADVDSTYTETVKKVNSDGGAEIEVAVSDFRIQANGQDIPAPAPETRTVKVDRNGVQVGAVEESSVSRLVPDLWFGFARGRDLASGHELTLEFADPSDPKSKTTGTVALLSNINGIAKIGEKLQITYSSESAPMRVDATSTVFESGSTLQSMEGKITNLPSTLAGRYNVQSADFTLQRA